MATKQTSRTRGTVKSVTSKKKKPRSLTSLKKELWSLCRAITAKRYKSTCFTCNRAVEGKSRHLGHFIPSSVGGAALRYNLDNLRWQCYHCNINLSGNWPAYLENLTKEIGKDRVDILLALKKRITKADTYFYEQTIEQYKKL